MINKVSKKIFNLSGLGILFSFLFSFIAAIPLIISIFVMTGVVISVFLDGSGRGHIPTILIASIVLFITLIIAGIAGIFSQAGLLGSYKDGADGIKISFKSYCDNGKKYFWSYFGWSFLYGFSYMIIFIPMFIGLIIGIYNKTISDNSLLLIYPFIMTIVFIAYLWLFPKLILSVLKLDKHGFIKAHFKKLALVAGMASLLSIIPGGGAVIGSFLKMVYPIYILDLYYDSQGDLQDTEDTNKIDKENYPGN